jgi:ferredoxin, 2Fe-2S
VPRVTVEPASVSFDVEPEENMLAAALRAGIRWPTVCQGAGVCTTCHFFIRDGYEHFPPLTALEREALIWIRRRQPQVPEDHIRLACQTTISGDVLVYCRGARPAVLNLG